MFIRHIVSHNVKETKMTDAEIVEQLKACWKLGEMFFKEHSLSSCYGKEGYWQFEMVVNNFIKTKRPLTIDDLAFITRMYAEHIGKDQP